MLSGSRYSHTSSGMNTLIENSGCNHILLTKYIKHLNFQVRELSLHNFQDAHGISITSCSGRTVVYVVLRHTFHDKVVIVIDISFHKKVTYQFFVIHNCCSSLSLRFICLLSL
ncbi:hypothetical protein BMERY_1930 [Bifidobacterium merycicum]|uniref:Uncharacterized protein n=1 Tax=Bifidobacterium merycicum TaxID=78345 RepID=A0A087BBT0_9BIFI|nr:hypothetical protein BMERY_1930 [Bifidobacterium merycicum]